MNQCAQLGLQMGHATIEQILALSELASERLVDTGRVLSPVLTGREGRWLLFNYTHRSKLQPSPDLVLEFAELARASDEAIYRFARRWGALGIAKNGWPVKFKRRRPVSSMFDGFRAIHDTGDPHFVLAMLRRIYLGEPGPDLPYRESLTAWRLLARRLSGLLRIAAALHRNQCGTREDWLELAAGENNYDFSQPWTRRDDIFLPGIEMAVYMNAMIERFKICPHWVNHKPRWQMRLACSAGGVSTLAGILALQAMMIVADKDGLVICSYCNRPYTPRRMPAHEKRNYCERKDCIRARERDRKRKQRSHLKAQSAVA
jgi:hypothetical protein